MSVANSILSIEIFVNLHAAPTAAHENNGDSWNKNEFQNLKLKNFTHKCRLKIDNAKTTYEKLKSWSRETGFLDI